MMSGPIQRSLPVDDAFAVEEEESNSYLCCVKPKRREKKEEEGISPLVALCFRKNDQRFSLTQKKKMRGEGELERVMKVESNH